MCSCASLRLRTDTTNGPSGRKALRTPANHLQDSAEGEEGGTYTLSTIWLSVLHFSLRSSLLHLRFGRYHIVAASFVGPPTFGLLPGVSVWAPAHFSSFSSLPHTSSRKGGPLQQDCERE